MFHLEGPQLHAYKYEWYLLHPWCSCGPCYSIMVLFLCYRVKIQIILLVCMQSLKKNFCSNCSHSVEKPADNRLQPVSYQFIYSQPKVIQEFFIYIYIHILYIFAIFSSSNKTADPALFTGPFP